jgi:hypothetical protein
MGVDGLALKGDMKKGDLKGAGPVQSIAIEKRAT